MHPRRDNYQLVRSQTVTVDHTLGGYWADPYHESPTDWVPVSVRWPGTGGYWCEAVDWEMEEG